MWRYRFGHIASIQLSPIAVSRYTDDNDPEKHHAP